MSMTDPSQIAWDDNPRGVHTQKKNVKTTPRVFFFSTTWTDGVAIRSHKKTTTLTDVNDIIPLFTRKHEAILSWNPRDI